MTDTATKEDPRPAGGDRRRGLLRELPVLLLVAFLVALLLKTFVVQAFYIPSESMERTLLVGDRVLVNKVVYHLHPPRRGDIVVFSEPHGEAIHRNPVQGFLHWLTEGLGASTSPDKDYIKRVIGLPGETVEVHMGRVLINGRQLREDYPGLTIGTGGVDYGPTRIPAGNLFVLGDNRAHSCDSRCSLGFIPEDKVVGRAFVILWPPSRFGFLHR